MDKKNKIEKLYKILQERDMPAYPIAAKKAGINYTDYLTGAHKEKPFNLNIPQPEVDYVYTPNRNRQCAVGYHEECTDKAGKKCGCPCHQIIKLF